MRNIHVRHDPLPGIGDVFELDTSSGFTVTVVAHRSGRRDVSVAETGAEDALGNVALSRTEAIALATLLSGAHIDLKTTPRT